MNSEFRLKEIHTIAGNKTIVGLAVEDLLLFRMNPVIHGVIDCYPELEQLTPYYKHEEIEKALHILKARRLLVPRDTPAPPAPAITSAHHSMAIYLDHPLYPRPMTDDLLFKSIDCFIAARDFTLPPGIILCTDAPGQALPMIERAMDYVWKKRRDIRRQVTWILRTSSFPASPGIMSLLKERNIRLNWVPAPAGERTLLEQVLEGYGLWKGLAAGNKPGKKWKIDGIVTAAVSPDGGIYPCHGVLGVPRYVIGAVGAGIDADKIQGLGIRRVGERSACSDCWARYICGGGSNLKNVAQVDNACAGYLSLVEQVLAEYGDFDLTAKNTILYIAGWTDAVVPHRNTYVNKPVQSSQPRLFTIHGRSMWPLLKNGDKVTVVPVNPGQTRFGDIICFAHPPVCHRIIAKFKREGEPAVLEKGDHIRVGTVVPLREITGKVVAVIKTKKTISIETPAWLGVNCIIAALSLAIHGICSALLWRRYWNPVMLREDQGKYSEIERRRDGHQTVPACAAFWARHLCGGPCPRVSFQKHGKLDKLVETVCASKRHFMETGLAVYA
ncbi:MAG: SPASM domain-containing protein [Candidatus Aminicenantes bacterium]|nr:SPASM domain-containing protein [Candidatus Aminicenantes bacterium]